MYHSLLLSSGFFLTDSRELGAVDTDHAQLADLSSSPEVEEGQTDDADLFVRARGAASDETSRVLASTDLQ